MENTFVSFARYSRLRASRESCRGLGLFFTHVDLHQVISQGRVEASHSAATRNLRDTPNCRLRGLQGPRAATNERVRGPPAIDRIGSHLAIQGTKRRSENRKRSGSSRVIPSYFSLAELFLSNTLLFVFVDVCAIIYNSLSVLIYLAI